MIVVCMLQCKRPCNISSDNLNTCSSQCDVGKFITETNVCTEHCQLRELFKHTCWTMGFILPYLIVISLTIYFIQNLKSLYTIVVNRFDIIKFVQLFWWLRYISMLECHNVVSNWTVKNYIFAKDSVSLYIWKILISQIIVTRGVSLMLGPVWLSWNKHTTTLM